MPASRARYWLAALAVTAAAGTLQAQVGHPAEHSPYADTPLGQELNLSLGHLSADKGGPGVGPQSGPLAAGRYEILIAGPMNFFSQVSALRSQRTVLDPTAPAATRRVGDRNMTYYLLDLGFILNLTGEKSYRRVIPTLSTGIGFASDFKGKRDPGGFHVGSSFTVALGTGVRWVASPHTEFRLDLTEHFYAVRYPTSYYVPPNGTDPAIRQLGQARSEWLQSTGLTLGISHIILR